MWDADRLGFFFPSPYAGCARRGKNHPGYGEGNVRNVPGRNPSSSYSSCGASSFFFFIFRSPCRERHTCFAGAPKSILLIPISKAKHNTSRRNKIALTSLGYFIASHACMRSQMHVTCCSVMLHVVLQCMLHVVLHDEVHFSQSIKRRVRLSYAPKKKSMPLMQCTLSYRKRRTHSRKLCTLKSN